MSTLILTVDDLTDEIVERAISAGLVNEESVVPNVAIKDISVNEEIVDQINTTLKSALSFLELIKKVR
ncbi:MAG: hypothetical protein WDZ40_00580 [Candidatus Spechtbacterales bacterium]